ncbi:hypothetical protein [Agrobacterium sp. ST15.13.040]|uniref:hypothetical protein n=1 Tax=Agrobacterium sp. ST15.13.040 TaxID=3017318 RepID=UPI0022EC3158
MGDGAAAYYKALFSGQVEKGEQTKKAASRRRKTTGAGPSAKRVRRALQPSQPELLEEEAGEDAGLVEIPPAEVPATSAEVPPPDLEAPRNTVVVEVPTAEERYRQKGKGLSSEGPEDPEDTVSEVPPGMPLGEVQLLFLSRIFLLLLTSFSLSGEPLTAGWRAIHERKRALRDATIPEGKIPLEPFWTITEDMNLFSDDCPKMTKEIWKGMTTDASFRAIAAAHPGDNTLAAKVTEHAAQV